PCLERDANESLERFHENGSRITWQLGHSAARRGAHGVRALPPWFRLHHFLNRTDVMGKMQADRPVVKRDGRVNYFGWHLPTPNLHPNLNLNLLQGRKGPKGRKGKD